MKFRAFEIEEPIPQLRNPHAFATLRPWVDVGSVGRLTFRSLERHFQAKYLAELSRPGIFFDFTRYRPTIYNLDGQRQVTVPNVQIRYARGPGENDFVFLHLLEPHMNGEGYVHSIVKLLEKLGVRRYCLLGAMYDLVPHTRPILVTGTATGDHTLQQVRSLGVHASSYEGPTSIGSVVSLEATKLGIETMGLVAHLPQYAQMEVDHTGRLRLLDLLCKLYNFEMDLERVQMRARQQNEEISSAMNRSPEVKGLVEQLERQYEDRMRRLEEGRQEDDPELSPEVQSFLDQLGEQFSQN
ncbi:PAC2 family protein [SAR202 cluster bacterium AC-647-N09_OGT_505m]|nr:PAC2 family protein [SAR202 cluster bacterium AC-647-N09_OGT_505m]